MDLLYALTVIYLKMFIMLFAYQLIIQIFMIIVRETTGEKRHTLLVWGRDLVGALDNVESIGFEWKRMVLVFGAFYSVLLTESFPQNPYIAPKYFSEYLIYSFFGTLSIILSRIFLILRIYTEGRGIGLNLYFNGYRIFGLDWHKWLQVEHNGKFLPKSQQVYSIFINISPI